MEFILIIFLIGITGAFISGMLGIGGSIINYPMLLLIPPLFGLHGFTAHEVSGISAIQVMAASIAAVWSYKKGSYLHKPLIAYMGTGILTGSLMGSFLSIYMSENGVNMIYALLALIAALMMFIPKKEGNDFKVNEVDFHKGIAVVLSILTGIGSGIVGAGGAFLLLPIMLSVLKIPIRVTIASSLAVTFISSVGTTAGKMFTGQIDYFPASILVIASLLAAPLGAKAGQKISAKYLQAALAILITAAAIKIWSGLF
ncbi:sulfite exporter TauE/SafE family protein [Metabacillus sp. KIGAM252]|uniref:Probable membrane transporter protein n=1 Tax=Metabacillus flavus TaxID=2823519 RepID=A0ABS5LEK9_9BACI|nr:sulfite exporter TauE/SafE family protein [Metabacillus flavus]MBS2969146.1 sulfite exporter TauE/SafE family protein [Metabacillus flavus]